ncbi:MAG: hypothetical protein RLZZ224_597 [Verrucomicrobiota bacterium]|jgi:hypothetical protein
MQRQYLKFVRRFYRQLRSPQMRKNRFFADLVHRLSNRRLWKPCRTTVAHGLAIGLFFSMMLPMPLQGFVSAFFAIRSRVNVPFAMLAVWISNPLTTLPLALMQVRLGQLLRDLFVIPVPTFLDVTGVFPCTTIECNAANFVLGMLVSGVLASMLAYPLVHLISMLLPHHLPSRREESAREKQVNSASSRLRTKKIQG